MKLVLASASPRRKELLTQAGFAFEVYAAGIDESRHEFEPPVAYVQRLAAEKARATFEALTSGAAVPGKGWGVQAEDHLPTRRGSTDSLATVVLGADTTVVLGGEVMNKPACRKDAESMLRALSGRTHQVHTGVAVLCARCMQVHVETTDVHFRPIEEEELRAYLDSGDPLDKAGAYGIQGYAARWIPRIQGDYFNVVGLPIAAVVKLLEQCMVAATEG